MSADNEFYRGMTISGASHEIMLQQAASMAGLGYFVFNIDMQIVEICSESHAAIFGQTPEGFIARATGTAGTMPMIHPDDVPVLRDAYRRIEAGETVDMEYRFVRADGATGVVREIVAPEHDASGRVIRGIGSSMDVTRAHDAARHRAEAQRLEALGALTAGVAHDFNNIFSIVMGHAELAALPEGGQDPGTLGSMQEIAAAAARGGTLTRKLLNFAQCARIEPRQILLDRVVRDAVTAFADTADARVRFYCAPDATDLDLRIDAEGLCSVLTNLLQNACDASARCDPITVSVHRVAETETARLKTLYALAPGTYAEFRVTDAGTGIAPADMQRVAEPFFSTRNRASRSGLGLSMADGFVRQSGGVLEIRSTEGTGTDVRVFLPLEMPKGEMERPEPPEPTVATHTVVLLEDDPSLRARLCGHLEASGHRVIPAASAQSLLNVIDRFPVDVALIDMVIHGLETGHGLAETIKARDPRIATVLYSGVTEADLSIRPPCVDAILPNPSTPDDLLGSVARILSRKPVAQRDGAF